MSLFKFIDWYRNEFPNASCMVTGELTLGREQLCIGTEQGTIIVVDPGGHEGKVGESTIIQHNLNNPIIQLEIGKFVTAIDKRLLAVLCPHHLLLFRVVTTTPNQNSKLEEVYTHALKEPSYNMCAVPTKTPQIFVQGLSCGLTLFQGEECVFQRTPLPALHPGPIVYSQLSDSLILTNAGRVSSVKFSLLASVSNTGKKITFDWTINMGDVVIDLDVADWNTVQPSLVVLCRRKIVVLTVGGNIRYFINLEGIAMSMMVYLNNTPGNKSTIHTVVGTANDTVLIYSDNVLIWNFKAPFSPTRIRLSHYGDQYQHLLSMMSSKGEVSAGYIGTEPTLHRLPLPPARFVNFDAKAQELNMMETALKGNTAAQQVQSTALELKVDWGELDRHSRAYNVNGEVPSLTLALRCSGSGFTPGEYQINLRSELAMQQDHFTLESEEFPLSISLFVNPEAWPTSRDLHIAVHNTRTQATALATLQLPLPLLFATCNAERTAQYKLTIDTDRPLVPIGKLFPEMNSDNPGAIGLQVHSTKASVSVFAAPKTNRYRIQSDHPGLLYMTAQLVTERLREQQDGVNLSAPIPLEYLVSKFEECLESEKQYIEEKKVIDKKMREVRAINALLVAKTKTTRAEPTSHVDVLFAASHDKLLDMLDQHINAQKKINFLKRTISSLLGLLGLLLKLNNIDNHITAHIFPDTSQSIKERLAWASNSSDTDVGRLLNALCNNATKQLSNITEEEADDGEYEEPVDENKNDFVLGSHSVATAAQPIVKIFEAPDEDVDD